MHMTSHPLYPTGPQNGSLRPHISTVQTVLIIKIFLLHCQSTLKHSYLLTQTVGMSFGLDPRQAYEECSHIDMNYDC